MDLINAFYAACLVYIAFYIFKVPMSYYAVVVLHLPLVFMTNGFLFPPSYMPDQFRYVLSAAAIRETMDFWNYELYDRSSKVAFSGLLFALFPIPSIKSVFSISIINFLLYSLMFIFLYRKNLLVGNALWFYLLFPSFALYAAVSLRDIWILLFMILSVYALYREKMLFSILLATPLLLIKAQNFLIFIAALIIYKSIEQRNLLNVKTLFRLTILLFLLVGFASMFSIEDINETRRSMYEEDGGILDNYIPIAGYIDFLMKGLLGAFYMILKPLPWEVHSPLQLMQSLENMFVFYLVYKIIREQKKVKDKFITFLLIYFFVGMAIYGIVVFNYGTAARYRFPFEVVFIVFSLSILHKYRKSRQAISKEIA